jgi:hypothetical protein
MDPALYSVFTWVIGVGIVWWLLSAVVKGFKSGLKGAGDPFCTVCGTEGQPRSHTRGSIGIELLLWLCLLLPGLLYSLWRLTTRRDVCGACGSERLVPADSPVAKQMKATMGAPKA